MVSDMGGRDRLLGLGVAAAAAVAAGGCDVIWGVHSARPYVADAGTSSNTSSGGSGGVGGSTSSTGGEGGAKVCEPGAVLASCYSGPTGTEGVGACKAGSVLCKPDGSGPGECTGEVTPQPETCADTVDNDCDGHDCVQWAGVLGNLQNQYGKAVSVDSAGNTFVAGTFYGSILLAPGNTLTATGQAAFLIKLDPHGVPLWGVTIQGATGSTTASAVTADAFGEVAIGGMTTGTITLGNTGTIGPTAYVAKFDGSGNPLWTRGLTPKVGLWDSLEGLASTPEGDVVAVGSFTSSIDFGDGPNQGPSDSSLGFGFVTRLVRASGSGKVSDGGWGRVLCGGASQCYATNVAVDASGDILLAGRFKGLLSLGTGASLSSSTQALFFGMLTSAGVPNWQWLLSASGGTISLSGLATDPQGNATLSGSLTGTTDFGGGNVVPPAAGAGYVVHYRNDKAYAWSKLLENGTPRAVAADSSGNVFFAGSYSGSLDLGGPSPLPGAGMFVGKVSKDNEALWGRGYSVDLVTGMSMAMTVSGGAPILLASMGGKADIDGISLQTAGMSDVMVTKLSP